MGLLRSETMKEGLLVLPQGEGQARKYLDVIGQETSIQFEDMNAHVMVRPYRRHVQRIEEMERILRYLYEELNKMNLTIVTTPQIDKFLEADKETPYDLDAVEAKLKAQYEQWTVMMDNNEKLTTQCNHVAEEVEVLGLASKMLTNQGRRDADGLDKPLLTASRMLKAVAGVIAVEDQVRFSRAVFRASRGNSFTHFSAIDQQITDPKTGNVVNKVIFVIMFQGNVDEQSAMHTKILKVCSTFGVNNYAWPADSQEANDKLKDSRENLNKQRIVLAQFADYVKNEASELLEVQNTTGREDTSRSSLVEEWRMFCVKEKSIYACLNMFEGEMHLRANVWFAASEEKQILEILENAKGDGAEYAVLKTINNSKKEPPTYIRTNEFTDCWQCVINTYGVPRYQEANPALFACVTFPFIFGMMYGDVGHGTCLMVLGSWLCWKGKALLDIKDIGEGLYWARFLVLQLGIYATFAGLLYNDMFSIGLPIFATRYENVGDGNWVPTWDHENVGNGKGGPYPFGVDWAWHGATNELLFMNSMKMKLSVLFGVLQMTLGVFLRFGNSVFFKSKIDFVFECIPMLIFMVCFFGWMDFMILYKWVNVIPSGPPGVINSLICMAMGPMGVGQTDEYPLWPSTDGGMSSVQLSTVLMNLAVLSIPWLLIFKPFLLKRQHEQSLAEGGTPLIAVDEEKGHSGGGGHGHGDGEFNFGEILIHQIIETIEYVLGTVSHTASYLRIWALSLAHQQLSSVFYTKTIGMALTSALPAPMNGIAIYCAFCIWFAITCAVLLGMDVLECFLHTLRLHWVEFDSKFFKADGYAFEPYNVKGCIAASNA